MNPNSFSEKIEELRHYLPTQGHIKDFIHHNTLHAFEEKSFHEALILGARLYGAQAYLSPKEYLSLIHSGHVSDAGVEMEARIHSHRKTKEALVEELEKIPPSLTARKQLFPGEIEEALRSFLIRLTSSFLDQGISVWVFPKNQLDFWSALQEIVRESMIPWGPFRSLKAKKLLQFSPVEAAIKALSLLGEEPILQEEFLRERLFFLPGWAGLINEIEKNPDTLTSKRNITLLQWLSVFLVAEVGFRDLLGKKTRRSTQENFSLSPHVHQTLQWAHGAWEWSQYLAILKAMQNNYPTALKSPSRIQVITCIDDREFMLKHFLEELHPELETFGAPGFFGVDCFIQIEGQPELEKHCPVPVTPQHILVRKSISSLKGAPFTAAHRKKRVSLFHSWFLVHLLGIRAGFRLALGIFNPHIVEKRRLDLALEDLEIQVLNTEKKIHPQGFQYGYSVEQAAIRVERLLRTIGMLNHFAPLIAIVGHGASSTNNPYFSAYDCGACSGRPGALNAKAFCEMANNKDVRALLSKNGISIPEKSIFFPFLHDTTADVMVSLCSSPPAELTALFEKALSQNAQFRCRQFDTLKKEISETEAHRAVKLRSVAWYEPRPEYNHATNIACIVGRRTSTKGMIAERATFLQSYDPALDPNGETLGNILQAVIPVCGGINLEYFFSRMDPEIYGAGTKLPQNVSALVGVVTGLESDLRTGLPKQMTEIHDPLRLLLVLEQRTEIIDKALSKVPSLIHWIENGWMWLVAQEPEHKFQTLYHPGLPQKWQKI